MATLGYTSWADQFFITPLLHDVVEDVLADPEEIREQFGPEIHDAVMSVTRYATETYMEFIRRAKPHPIGKLVKIADIADNLLSGQSRARLKPQTMTVTFEDFSPTHDFLDYTTPMLRGNDIILFSLLAL